MRRPAWFFLLLWIALFSPAAGMASGNVYHGNWSSRIYHNADCKYFTCKRCTVNFSSAGEAEASGYRPCKICGGGALKKRDSPAQKRDSAR
jgi:methylphosphotriester-DNA--protein-cysteine methyltransferase